jgi:hypothetical protein
MRLREGSQRQSQNTPTNLYRANRAQKPPSYREWIRLPILVRMKITWWVWRSVHPPPPVPVHFSIMAGLMMFLLIPIMPDHEPLTIPAVIGGGLSGALILIGGRRGK